MHRITIPIGLFQSPIHIHIHIRIIFPMTNIFPSCQSNPNAIAMLSKAEVQSRNHAPSQSQTRHFLARLLLTSLPWENTLALLLWLCPVAP